MPTGYLLHPQATTEPVRFSDFRSSYLPAATKRHACPACTPTMGYGWWERGTVGELAAYSCTNCGHTETFKAPKRPEAGAVPAPRQQRTLDRIKTFFTRIGYDGLETFEVTKGHGWTWYVVVKTGGSVWSQRGAHFVIGRTGTPTVLGIYDLCDKETSKGTAKHYAYMLDGQVSKNF